MIEKTADTTQAAPESVTDTEIKAMTREQKICYLISLLKRHCLEKQQDPQQDPKQDPKQPEPPSEHRQRVNAEIIAKLEKLGLIPPAATDTEKAGDSE